ncbi:type II toxin-antitoxin system HicA family toxin [Candidatus Gottesmanbacteria bacterium]|nr:type II toxin-antitoxin system HicA family toxin [Candidatus Gottesmanbacteria bacterium]
MPKLPSFTPRQIIERLKNLGFIEDHTTGSHITFYHPKTGNRAVVPFHLKDIPKGTLLSLIGEARISRDELLHA